MIKEQKYFLSLLSDFILEKDSSLPKEDIDYKKILEYAKSQNLKGVIYKQLKDLDIPIEILKELKSGFMSDVYLSVNSGEALKTILTEFSKAGIVSLPFKGTVIKDYWPVPELRTMGDRDILILHKDREASHRIMKSLGYEHFIDNHAVYTYTKRHLMFEIHDVMFYEDLSNDVDYRTYFSKVWDTALKKEEYRCLPSEELHFLYVITHTAKHITNHGMGYRAYLDLVFFVRKASLNWESVIAKLKELKLYEFTLNCFTLCEYWFNVSMPFSKEERDKEFMEYISEKTFRDGIFGLTNIENKTAHSAKEIRRSKEGYNSSALKLTVHKLFPPYKDMQLIPWYSWVDDRPWLLPIAWVYRWGYCLINKNEQSRDLLLEPYQKRKEIEQREEYLKKWGL